MKLFLTLALLFITALFFGQNNKIKEAAIFLDSAFISGETMKYFNPDELESVNVIKNDTVINNISYVGQIYITSKNPKKYAFISLEQVKSQFTKIKNNDAIYMINGAFIKDNYNTFKIDKNYILKVEITNSTEFYNLRNNAFKFNIINILVKTNENLDNENKIILRGYEAIGTK
ncbi:hypothetical protein FQU23_011975 [Flavobacterium sp. XN-5]|uniref:hypothetical protein n=1 Tax=Flavobacterium sp. XN-5 TaxID=2599390 RepID=UPI0011CBE313|nr:hypothetical protein [Flavobacterium sp. XN-5]NGY38227.1 hypothetical protein [Flavobacterium sp. XN-5]